MRTYLHFAGKIAVLGTYGVRRGHRVVRKLIIFRDRANQLRGRLPVRQLLAEEAVEHRAGRVERLQLVLDIQRREYVVGIADRKMRAVGVVRSLTGRACREDVRELLAVMLRKTVRGGFCRSCLEVVQIAVHLLVVAQTLTHVIEHLLCELLRLRSRHILADPLCVQARFVHTDKTDRRKMIVKRAEVTLRVRIQTLVKKLRDDGTLYLQGTCGNIHQTVESLVEISLVRCLVRDARHVDRHDTDAAGALARTEESAGLLAKLTQVKAQTAAHRTNVARLHVAVDIVAEVRRAVLRGHLKEKTVIFRVGPVEILRDGVCRDRILEAAAVRIALDHGLDKCLVDHVHLFLAVLVAEVELLAADKARKLSHIGRHGPVERDVRERRLRAPAARRGHAVYETLDALLDFLVGKVVDLDERRKIRVKRGKCLRAGPLVLHDTEEVDHLVHEGREMLCRGRGDLAGNSAQAFHDELLQGPACAVSGQHGEVMDVNVGVLVRVADLLIVDLGEPVVRRDGAGVVQDQTSDGIRNGRVLLHAPVLLMDVAVHDLLVIEDRRLHLTQFLTLLAIEDVCLRDVGVSGLLQDMLHAVLDVLHPDHTVLYFMLKLRSDAKRQKADDVGRIFLVRRLECLLDSRIDLVQVKFFQFPVPFCYLNHVLSTLLFYILPRISALRAIVFMIAQATRACQQNIELSVKSPLYIVVCRFCTNFHFFVKCT